MNVTSLSSSSLCALSSSQGATAAASARDPDGDGDDHTHVHRGGHHRGAVGSAVMAALQSLGLAMPQPPAGAAPGNASATPSNGQDAGSSVDNVGQDMRKLMHALFDAARSEQDGSQTPTSGSNAGASATQPSPFASGLSALITQVANGAAPADLQSAFTQLVQDIGQTSGAASGNASATLKDFLTNLQANLGYAATGGSGAGNLVATQA
jgi:hypothetical protein